MKPVKYPVPFAPSFIDERVADDSKILLATFVGVINGDEAMVESVWLIELLEKR